MGQPSNARLKGMVRGTWRFVDLVDSGGMGAIYRGQHIKLPIEVAIKVLLPAHEAHPGLRARFEREARIGAQVQHPNLVRTLDLFTDEEHQYIVMDWLEGENVGRRLLRGPMSVPEAIAVALGAAAGLAAAHAQGVIHRDIKPGNIFLARTPAGVVPKVLDFGISLQPEGPRLTREGLTMGTPPYMSPEQFVSTRDVDARTDIYSLGVVLYEMLTGKNPFEDGDPARLHHRVASMALPSNGRIPKALFDVICRATEKIPARRFASVAELQAEIERVYFELFGWTPVPVSASAREAADALGDRVSGAARAEVRTSMNGSLSLRPTSFLSASAPQGLWGILAGAVAVSVLVAAALGANGAAARLRESAVSSQAASVTLPVLLATGGAATGLIRLARACSGVSVGLARAVVTARVLLAYCVGLGLMVLGGEVWAIVHAWLTHVGERRDVVRRVAYRVLLDSGLLWVGGILVGCAILWLLHQRDEDREDRGR
ncbi:MAG: serine/threonine protein kinase [Polyangiaceae bacterium]|nr:serine/threonine protein kinase [Polyangiaceae bacterium]